jgi:hypothetical protein
MADTSQMSFEDAVNGLMAGDFSRLSPLFESPSDGVVIASALPPDVRRGLGPAGVS